MSKNEDKPGIVWNLCVIAFSIAAAPWWSWVAAKLWTWFLVPLSAPTIGLAHMYGISALVGMFTAPIIVNVANVKSHDQTERERDMFRVICAWLAPLFALTFGAVARHLM